MNPTFQILEGDCVQVLRTLDSESVHAVITSPPYWGLRNYGIDPSVWGGNPNCRHEEWSEWEEFRNVREESISGKSRTTDRYYGDETRRFDGNHQKHSAGQFCRVCRAWRGALGLEPTPALYIQHIVEVFRAVRRVLRKDGSLWLNLGDCYVTNPHGVGNTHDPKYHGGRDRSEGRLACNRTNNPATIGLKSKDLVMMPARVAIALQEDGWYLRSQIPWVKRNALVESVTDRPSVAVEYVFLFSRSEDYFYDVEATLLPQADHERTRRLREQKAGLATVYEIHRDDEGHGQVKPGKTSITRGVEARQRAAIKGTRRRRNSDWLIESLDPKFQGMLVDDYGRPVSFIVNPEPFTTEMCDGCAHIYSGAGFRRLVKVCSACSKENLAKAKKCSQCDESQFKRLCPCGSTKWVTHFATFPERLVTPMIQASTSDYGCCTVCGTPYVRILERQAIGDWHPDGKRGKEKTMPAATTARAKSARDGYLSPVTNGWRPDCSHPMFPGVPGPPTVLDPFSGSGRTGLACSRLQRSYIGVERNPQYAAISRWQYQEDSA